jgi:hypothetical protein
MSEYNIKLQIEPENYDYGEEEIVYRIFFYDDEKKYKQLINERSLPILGVNQVVLDSFNISFDKKILNFLFENIKNKKCFIKKIYINGEAYKARKGCQIFLKEKLVKISQQ